MTLNVSMRFQRRAWATPQIVLGGDQGLPLGYWTATAESEGDGSGGDLTFQHIFSAPSNGLGDSNLYSIEQVMIRTTLSGLSSMELVIQGMDPGTGDPSLPTTPVDCHYAVDLDVTDQAVATRAMSRPNGYKIWVGRYDGIPTDFGDMRLRGDNPGVSDKSGCKFQGYFWAPGAINSPLGIRKPQGDIYGV